MIIVVRLTIHLRIKRLRSWERLQTKIADAAKLELAKKNHADCVSYTHRGSYYHVKLTRIICE